jgi:K+-transporting ATPase KdpF subunit
MKTTILLAISNPIEQNMATGYAIGAVIALLLLCYLVYSLVKPEKF